MDCSVILSLWRKWIKLLVVVTYIILLVIALPLCVVELNRKGASNHVQAWFVGGLFVMMALPISFWGILQHIINYTNPQLQRYIIRILWMVPIYALNAWFALRFPSAAIYLDTLRECYEAYVIYNFMAYLMAFLNTEYPHLDIHLEDKPPVHHIFPLCWFPPSHNNKRFLQRCKHGVLQYTVVRPVMTVIALVTEMFGCYEEGDFNFTTAWSYIVIINNVSQILAMYCLVLFYKAFREELQPLRPVPKFICVKAVVFLSFWQALLIAVLAKTGVLPANGTWVFYKDIKEVATGLQDFLICVEMLLASLGHYFAFSHKPFLNLAAEQGGFFTSFLSMWDVRDVGEDIAEHARYVGRGMHKTLVGKRQRGDQENAPLLGGGSSPSSQGSYSRLNTQQSVETMQTRKVPSPVCNLDPDGRSLYEDSGNYGNDGGSFVNRSSTQSMNNYVGSFDTNSEISSDTRSLIHHTDAEQATLKHNTQRTQGESPKQQPDIYNDNVFEHLDVEENPSKDSGYLESQDTGTKEEGGKGEESNLLDLDSGDKQKKEVGEDSANGKLTDTHKDEGKGETEDNGQMLPTDGGWGEVSIKVGGVSQVQGSDLEETS